MHLTKLILSNYRSFAESTEISLQPGMNLLLGENNSGKSTVLQCLSMNSLAYEPHLSLETKPSPSTTIRSEQRIAVEACINKHNVWKYLGEQALLPVSEPNGVVTVDFPAHLRKTTSLNFEFAHVHALNTSPRITFSQIIDKIRYGTTISSGQSIMCYRPPAGATIDNGIISLHNNINSIFNAQWHEFSKRLYRFRAERLNTYQSPFGASTTLSPDASNLAECLNSMQSQQPHLFEEYIEYVNHIFPTVHRAQAVAVPGQQTVEIRIWLAPANVRRFDLSIPLSQAGTGISQVLAILYVAMSSLEPIVIGIDEPNSFLHPKAVRSLLQILNNLTIKHQYIITTHSPEVIRAAEPNGISVVINDRSTSRAQRLDPTNIEHIKDGSSQHRYSSVRRLRCRQDTLG